MELFKTNKLLFILFLILPIDKDVKLAWKYLIIFCGLFIFVVEVIGFIASIFYLLEHILDDLSEILYVFFQITALSTAIIGFIIGIVIGGKFVTLIEGIQNIYDSSKNSKL